MATVRPRAAPPMAHLVSFSPSILEVWPGSSGRGPGLTRAGDADMVTNQNSYSITGDRTPPSVQTRLRTRMVHGISGGEQSSLIG